MFLFAFLALIAPAEQASAHAGLLGTTPENGAVLEVAPAEVVLDFSEPVGPVEGEIALFGGDGNRVPLEARASGTSVIVSLPAELATGTYVVQWRVISADSHPIGGTVSFSVGAAGDAPAVDVPDAGTDAVDAANIAVQALAYLGMFAAVGITLFRWLVAPLQSDAARRMVVVASATAMVALALLVPLTTLRQTGGDLQGLISLDPWVERVTEDPLVQALVGIVGLTGLLALMPMAVRGRIGWQWPTVLGLVALMALPLVGHTRSKEPVVVVLLMDVAHLIVGALWFGGMIALMLALRDAWSRRDEDGTGQAAAVVARYSGLAGLIVPVVAISGASMALIIVDGWEPLTGTTYGKTLIAKIAVVVVIVLIAAWNRFRLVPAAASRDAETALRWLKRTVAVEATLLAAVLVLSGALVTGSPVVSGEADGGAQDPTTKAFRTEVALDDDHLVEILIEPVVVGDSTVTMTIRDMDGRVVRSTQPIELSWSLPAQELGPITMMMEDPDDMGVYTTAFTIPFEGQWNVEIKVRIDRFTESRTTIEVPVPDQP